MRMYDVVMSNILLNRIAHYYTHSILHSHFPPSAKTEVGAGDGSKKSRMLKAKCEFSEFCFADYSAQFFAPFKSTVTQRDHFVESISLFVPSTAFVSTT